MADIEKTGLYRIAAVVVVYLPNFGLLEKGVSALVPQVDAVLLVDNSGSPDAMRWVGQRAFRSKVRVLCMGHNTGVGEAHNRGISWAISHEYTHVLLMDQDSVPHLDMVRNLFTAILELQRRRMRVSAVGPRYIDPRTGQSSAIIRFGPLKFKKLYCEEASQLYVRADFLVSSGSLVPLTTIAQVGPMDASLFIDHVDTDWFLRANENGYSAYVVCEAVMEHLLGERPLRIWLGRWRSLPRHTPVRYYYIFRNSILLYRRSYAKIRWVINDMLRLGVIFAVLMAVVSPRRQYAVMILRGVLDGARGRAGPYRGKK
jgi:rhamnosyltransferase